MKRVAFKMYLHEGQKDEYKKRHDEIWPDLEKLLKENGISEYSIFIDEQTNVLFAVQNKEDVENEIDIRQHPVMKKWWDFMADIMEVNPDNSPVADSLEEVFYMK